MTNPSSQRLRIGAVPAVVVLALVLTAGSSVAATASASRTATAAATPRGQVVTPGEVDSIVASDTAINNKANASLSITLQDSHESCLQDVLDDATYRGELAAGAKTLGGSFDQVPQPRLRPPREQLPGVFQRAGRRSSFVPADDHQPPHLREGRTFGAVEAELE